MFTRILFVCHKVFYHQINAWIVHGQLVDICQEFFIHKLEHNKGKGPTPVDATKEEKSELNKTNVSGVTNKEGPSGLFSSILAFGEENFGQDDSDNEWNT